MDQHLSEGVLGSGMDQHLSEGELREWRVPREVLPEERPRRGTVESVRIAVVTAGFPVQTRKTVQHCESDIDKSRARRWSGRWDTRPRNRTQIDKQMNKHILLHILCCFKKVIWFQRHLECNR